MKIALVAGPWLPVPPPGYGGAEIIVKGLADGLVQRGHEVILFASGDSETAAKLVPYTPKHIGQDWPGYGHYLGDGFSEFAYVRSFLEKVDLVHDHTLHHHIGLPIKAIHTLHGPAQWGAETARKMSALNQPNYFVAISETQRRLYGEEGINFVGTVHNCIEVTPIPFSKEKGAYAVFVGRASWEKGPDVAVRVAKKAGIPLVMAVKMTERHEQEYFRARVEPLLRTAEVKLLGDVSAEEKFKLYMGAGVTLFTSQWEEPFGLVMIESMAAGTPVLAFKRGAAPEILEDGVTGYLCEDEDDMASKVHLALRLDRETCRERVAEKFSVGKMVEKYERIYEMVYAGVRRGITVGDVMTRRVISVSPETTREELAEIFTRHDISGVPVLKEGRLVGLVSETDILAKVGERVGDFMTKRVVTLSESDTVEYAATVLLRNNIKRAPVVRDGKVIGIVTRHDLVRALALRGPVSEVGKAA